MPEYDSTLEYRDVVGFPGYKVGNDGSVWSCWRLRRRHPTGGSGGFRLVMTDRWRKLKANVNKHYPRIGLSPGKTIRYVHHLVLEAFVGPRPEGMEACHFPDGYHGNNCLDNLKWGTRKENVSHQIPQGTMRRGCDRPNAKLDELRVREIRHLHLSGSSFAAIARRFKLSCGTIKNVVRRKTWKHIT